MLKVKWFMRVLAVASLCLFFVGCGSKSGDGAPTAKTPQSEPTPSVNQPTTSSTITTGMHILTSLCGAGGCPADEHPYEVVLVVEFQRANGWINVAEVDTGVLGDVTLGTNTPGNYRLSAKNPQPSGIVPATPPSPKTVTVVAGTVSPVSLQFH